MKITDQDIVEMEMDAEDQIEMNGTYDIDGDDFYAMLHRLDAAEKCLYLMREGHPEEVAYELWKERADK